MDGQLVQKKDCSKVVEVAYPEATALAKGGKLGEAVEVLLAAEKQCRVGNDVQNLRELILFTIKLVREHQDWELLNNTLTLISKRRQQNKTAITAMVQQAMTYLDQTPNPEIRLALIVTLRDITDGKIFVEAERARLTRLLSQIKEGEGKIDEACDILQDVHVETYGSLDKKEKADFILEQIRLTLAKKDFIRTLIMSKKVTRKMLQGEDMQELKVRFYRLMIEYHTHEKSAFEICQHYHNIYDTPIVKADPASWKEALQSTVIFLTLSQHSNEQQDMLQRVYRDEKLAEIPVFKDILKLYITPEIIRYPLAQQAEIQAHSSLNQFGPDVATYWLNEQRTRVIQHNIRVMSKYYKRVRLTRTGELLNLPVSEVEKNIAIMVSDGNLYAKVDRPSNMVAFAKPKMPEETLSDWASDISELLGLVERTCHLINKENMVQGQV